MAIPSTLERTLEQDGIIRTMAIDLSDNVEDRAMIIEILRSKLYSDKMLAPIREYSTNAVDSQVEAGFPNLPITITLPNILMPEFRVRDYGIGLTPEEVERTYIKYGRSTKRGTNAQTGQLGLGCKSAFAYGDNFVVVSYKNGVKTTYNLTVNGVCTVVCAEPMDESDRNGIEVIIPVEGSHVSQFERKALEFFKYWKVLPEFKGGQPDVIQAFKDSLQTNPIFSSEDWEIIPRKNSYYNVDGVAVMGNVSYPIDWTQFNTQYRGNNKEQVLYDFVRQNQTVLRVNIGELDFSASRESLEYTEKTCKAITLRLESVMNSIFTILNDKIATATTYWEALIIYGQIFGTGDDALFGGNVSRLETYYKDKFVWNGIPINSGSINVSDWDVVHGQVTEDMNKQKIYVTTPVVKAFREKDGRISEVKLRYHSVLNRIPASKKVAIIIHDISTTSVSKVSIRYLLTHHFAEKPSTIYYLQFKDDAQKQSFYDTVHFESFPKINLSDVVEKAKNWSKSQRATAAVGSTGKVIKTQTLTKYIKPSATPTFSSSPEECVLDRRAESGYFIRENAIDSVDCRVLAKAYHTLFTLLGETVDKVCVFNNKTTESGWFALAQDEDQWIDLREHFRSNKEKLIDAFGRDNINKYKTMFEDGYPVSEKNVKVLRPLIKDNTSPFAIMLDAIDKSKGCIEFLKNMRIVGVDLTEESTTKASEDVVENVLKAYPMFTLSEVLNLIRGGYYPIENNVAKTFADYINLMDTVNSKVDNTDQTV